MQIHRYIVLSAVTALFLGISVASPAQEPAAEDMGVVPAEKVLKSLLPTRGNPQPTMPFPLVNFEFDSVTLTEEGRAQLDEIGEALANPLLSTYTFELSGHTDKVGNAAYNLRLSERRAQAARDYLVSNFSLAPDRFELKGLGETKPYNPDDPDDPRNRRVEVTTLGGE